MKIFIFLIIFCSVSTFSFSQNQIRVQGGFFMTNTSIAEYDRGLDYFYLDSVTIDSKLYSPALNIDMDIELGKGFFITTGLGYIEKGVASNYYNIGDYWYDGKKKYLGMNFQVKYHYKFKNEKLGFFTATGFKADFAILGPNNSEIATVDGSRFFQAFGTFSPVDFGLNTTLGLSYKLGPGDIVVDVNFVNGLSDIFSDQFIYGRSFSTGALIGYSFYLE